jgi:hypothetical protein
MSLLPPIFNTPVLSDDFDAFWKNRFEADGLSLHPRPTLVLTHPLTSGSADAAQLVRMLQACQLSPDDYHILDLAPAERLAWHHLRDHLKPRNILLLGIEADQLGVGIQFMPHQVNRFNDCSWLPTLSIPQLEQYTDIKKHLWNYGLKPVFIDKVYG